MQATNGVAVSERWQASEAFSTFSGEHMFWRSSSSSLKMPRPGALWRSPSVQEMAEFPGQKLPREMVVLDSFKTREDMERDRPDWTMGSERSAGPITVDRLLMGQRHKPGIEFSRSSASRERLGSRLSSGSIMVVN